MGWIFNPGSGGGTPNPAAGPVGSVQLSDGAGANTYAAGFTYAGTTLQGSGLSLTMTPATPSAAQDAGTFTLAGQSATAAGHAGGGVAITGGNAPNGAAGDVNITAGTRTLAGNGASVNIRSGGANQTPNLAGDINLTAGNGPGAGSITLRGGTALAGVLTGGKVSIIGGTQNDFSGCSVIIGSGVLGTAAIEVKDDSFAYMIGLYGVTPTLRATTAVAAAAFVANAGTGVNDASTFGGYTIKQIVKALQLLGALT